MTQTSEKPILSVTDISLSLKLCVEKSFSAVYVRGEVSGLKKAPSGHIYFSLKDKDSVLSAVCWRGRNKITVDALQEGLEVICFGKLSTYPGRSNYQMIVDEAEPAGVGALLKLLADRKEKLETEGLFDPAHKKPIPFLPTTIGVITSPTGAVIRDIMHRLNDRFPRNVVLWPVLVQGNGAAEQITAAINGFNAIPDTGMILNGKHINRPDVIIVARGGGSLEDLWCFNEENVVRAVYNSTIPLISAVGHETDTTLIDYASDLRAPTPTAAAEKAVPVRMDLLSKITQHNVHLTDAMYRMINEKSLKIDSLSRGIPKLSDVINVFLEKLDDKTERLTKSISTYTTTLENKLLMSAKLLRSYSYHSILERGFTLITDSAGHLISTAKQAKTLPTFTIQFSDENLPVAPLNGSPSAAQKKSPAKSKKSSPQIPQQSFFDME